MEFRESRGRSALLICMIAFHARAYYSTLTGIFLLFDYIANDGPYGSLGFTC